MEKTRREFLKASAAVVAGSMLGGCMSRAPCVARLAAPKFMWAYLAHFGMKLWERRCHYTDLKVDDSMWKSLTERAAKVGVNVFVIDLGEGMVFPSHPELAVRGSWEPERMKDEIARLKKMGMMAVPKLNFSSSHETEKGRPRYEDDRTFPRRNTSRSAPMSFATWRRFLTSRRSSTSVTMKRRTSSKT